MATDYIAERFESFGLLPASNGSYFQDVPVVGMKPEPGDLVMRGRSDLTLK
ncbi:hypothetical protein MTLP_04690 [Candidatus Methanoliparum sp. LAM-1]|nr:hypothetical protein MTLP_04690 [Candidatus Methanoliparum sp. LAM-1]